VDRVGAMFHRLVKKLDHGGPVAVREVKVRKGSRWGHMRSGYTKQNGKSWSGPGEWCWVKFDQRDLSDTRQGEDPNCMKRRRRAG
jgi:hypothetical protein